MNNISKILIWLIISIGTIISPIINLINWWKNLSENNRILFRCSVLIISWIIIIFLVIQLVNKEHEIKELENQNRFYIMPEL